MPYCLSHQAAHLALILFRYSLSPHCCKLDHLLAEQVQSGGNQALVCH